MQLQMGDIAKFEKHTKQLNASRAERTTKLREHREELQAKTAELASVSAQVEAYKATIAKQELTPADLAMMTSKRCECRSLPSARLVRTSRRAYCQLVAPRRRDQLKADLEAEKASKDELNKQVATAHLVHSMLVDPARKLEYSLPPPTVPPPHHPTIPFARYGTRRRRLPAASIASSARCSRPTTSRCGSTSSPPRRRTRAACRTRLSFSNTCCPQSRRSCSASTRAR